MHIPKVAGKYFNSLFFKMTANAILKTRKSNIFWTRLAKGAYKVSFPIFWHHRSNRKIAIMFLDGLDLQIQDGR